MKTLQFDLAEFNPDGMNEDEIKEWIAFIGQGYRPQVAKQWFPGIKGQFEHTRNIRNYLWNKLSAIITRKAGRIQTAMLYERICERIYNQLPPQARW